jgi:hypothetical protein
MSKINNMDKLDVFCSDPSQLSFDKLPVFYKKNLHDLSKKIVSGKVKGNKILATTVVNFYEKCKRTLGKIIPQSWRQNQLDSTNCLIMSIIPSQTLLFRGQKKKNVLQDRPTYFALEIGNANQYLPASQKGLLSIYRTNHPLKLFRLDDLENVNKILRETFIQNPPVYQVIKSMFLSKILELKISNKEKCFQKIIKNRNPIQFNVLVRNSIIKNDFIFANWLCGQGYDGYCSGLMHIYEVGSLRKSFPEEVMICYPFGSVDVIQEIEMKKEKDRVKLDQILQNIK